MPSKGTNTTFRVTVITGRRLTRLRIIGKSNCIVFGLELTVTEIRNRHIGFPDTQAVVDINRRADKIHEEKFQRAEAEAKYVVLCSLIYVDVHLLYYIIVPKMEDTGSGFESCLHGFTFLLLSAQWVSFPLSGKSGIILYRIL